MRRTKSAGASSWPSCGRTTCGPSGSSTPGIAAPLAGSVIIRAVQPGEHVEAGQQPVTVADLRRTRIEAEVDEFDAGRVAVGASVEVTVEGYTGQSWKGILEEIPDAVTTRRLKPQNPGRPSDTRVLLVKIALQEPAPLKLGQRVEVRIGAEGDRRPAVMWPLVCPREAPALPFSDFSGPLDRPSHHPGERERNPLEAKRRK